MSRLTLIGCLLFVAACSKPAERNPGPSTTRAPAAPSSRSTQDSQREALLARHRELFTFLGLSQRAVNELLGKVGWVHDGIQRNRAENPEAFRALEGITQRGNPQSLEEALGAHRRRFEILGLTLETQRELAEGFTRVYQDLRTPNPSERALAIRELMRQLPPCCDDNIFRRAGANP